MDQIFGLFGQVLESVGLDELSILLFMIVLVICAVLFRYFINRQSIMRENEADIIALALQEYSDAISKIIEYKEMRISETELVICFTKLLPFCSNKLKNLIIEYQELFDGNKKDENNNKTKELIDIVIQEFSSIKYADKTNIFKKLGMSLLDKSEYVFSFSGLGNILNALLLTFLSISSFFVIFAIEVTFSSLESSYDKGFFLFVCIYFVLYIMVLIGIIESFSVYRIKNGRRGISLILLNFVLPIIFLFFENREILILSFILFVEFTIIILKSELIHK